MHAIEYAAEPHDTFDIFNDRYFGQGDSSSSTAGQLASSFPLWLDLPKEIRLRIWTWHLRQRRFLRVLLEERSGLDQSSRTAGDGVSPTSSRCPGAWDQRSDADQHEWTAFFSKKLEVAQDELEGPEIEDHEDGPLRITFLDRPISPIEALLLVCRESHEAYISFYPIRLPALIRVAFRLSDRDGSNLKTRPIIAHLHPDLDTLNLQAVHAPDIIERNLLPLFLHTMIQHDASPVHKRFGTRNLCVDLVHLSSDYAFDTNEPKDTEIPGNVSTLPLEILSSVRLSISHLRNLYLRLVTPHLEPRVMSGFLSGSGSLPWYNTSMPILPAPSWGFTAIVEAVEGVDPRLTAPEGIADLHQVVSLQPAVLCPK